MSTEFVIASETPIMYEAVLAHLPTGISVTWRSDSGRPLRPNRERIYIEGIDHVELRDACDNVVALRKANVVDKYGARQIGEAIFEQWGLGGHIQHFHEAFLKEYGVGLRDVLTLLPASDNYFGQCGCH